MAFMTTARVGFSYLRSHSKKLFAVAFLVIFVVAVNRLNKPPAPLEAAGGDFGRRAKEVVHANAAELESPPTETQSLPRPSIHTATVCTSNTALVLIAHDREEYLRQCLESLTRARRLEQVCVYVSMDDPRHFSKIRSVVEEFPLLIGSVVLIEQSKSLRKFAEPASAITWHHGKVFDSIFKERSFEYGIILESDLTVSPDFIEFMLAGRDILSNQDNSLFCISAWNDNGFENFQLSETSLYRTEFFPGLGWMLRRDSWTDVLSGQWPIWGNYDWWIRQSSNVRSLDCIAPEVSRTHHVSKYGVHVNGKAQETYERMVLSSGATEVPDSEWKAVRTRESFEERIRKEVFNPPHRVLRDSITDEIGDDGIVLVLSHNHMQQALKHLGLFSSELRGAYKGLLSFMPKSSNRLLTIIEQDAFDRYWNNKD